MATRKKTSANPPAASKKSNEKTQAKEEIRIVAKDIDPGQYVIVRNGFQGKLVYKSRRTGEHFVWDSFGSEQEMELKELRDAKNSFKKMFINNWFMFDEDWIIDYLGVQQYYKNAVKINDFDSVFSKTPEEIKNIIGRMSDGQKKSLSYRARQLIRDEEIDSRKSIIALEEVLDIELIEK